MGVHVQELKSKAEFEEAINGSQLVVVDAFAEWCGPCKMIAPRIEELASKTTDVKFIKIDVDNSPDIAQELGVRAMPSFYFFKNGEKITDPIVGANLPEIVKRVEANK